MKPLFSIVVAILVIAAYAHPENIEEVKELPQSKEPIVETEASDPQARTERCTVCSGSHSLKSTNDVLAAIKSLPNAEVHTQESFEGCSSEKGCAGVNVKDGKVVQKFGNLEAFQGANGNAGVFEGGVPNGGPFWWMNKDSPFKAGAAGGGGSFEKVSKSSSSYSSSSNGAGGVDLAANPFLNGDFSKLSGAGFGVGGNLGNAGANFGGAGGNLGGAGGNFANSQFSETSSSTFKEIDISNNPFLNGGVQGGGIGGQKTFGGGAQNAFGSNSQSAFAANSNSQGSFGGAQGGLGGAQLGLGGTKASFGGAQGSQNAFGASQGSQSVFESAQSSQSNQVGFGAGQANQGSFGFGQGYQGNFGAGQANQGTFGNTQSSVNAFNSGSKFAGNGYTGSSPAPFAPSSGANVNLIQNTRKNEYDFEQQQQNQQNIDEIFQSTGNVQAQGHSGGDLQQTCAGQGYVCVHKSQCNNGVVNTNGGGLLQANTQKQYCNTRTEICCRIETSSLAGAGNLQGSLGVGSGTFQASNQGSTLFSQSGSAQDSQSNFDARLGSGQSTTSGFGSGQSSTSGFNAVNRGTSGFVAQGNTNQFGAGSTYGTNKFGSTASSFGSTVTPTPSRFGSTTGFNNEVFKSTSQSNFVETDSFSAGSENNGVYRPGASGAGLKPGIPYLPPVDSSTSGSNVVSTGYPPAFVTTPRPFLTPRPVTTFSSPKPTYLPPVSTKAPEYLPPVDGITGSDSFPQPTYIDGQLILDETRQPNRPQQPPRINELPSGCAAALKCTPIEFCTRDGVISTTPVVLSRSQEEFRVPLTDCKDLGSGRVGKCCRDPFYTDPWPVNQLGKWIPGIFPGNDGKYVPDNNGSIYRNNFIPSTERTTPFNKLQIEKGGRGKVTITGEREKGIVNQYGEESTITLTRAELERRRQLIEQGKQVTTGERIIVKQPGYGIKETGGIITQEREYGIKQDGGIGIKQTGGVIVTQQPGYGIKQDTGFGIKQTGGVILTQQPGYGIKQTGGGIITQEREYAIKQDGGFGIKQTGGATVTQQPGYGIKQDTGFGIKQTGGVILTQQPGYGIKQTGGGIITQEREYAIKQDGGFGIRQTGGAIVTQQPGYGIKTQGEKLIEGQRFYENKNGEENEYSESVQRVYLPRYTGSGECGVLKPQKPYGNRKDLEVDFAEIPWQAMVLLETDRSLLCGGVITRPDVVITSASCVEGLDARNVLIKGGEWKLGIDEEPLPFQIVQVKHIVRHPQYQPGVFRYDAAILVLNENLRLANNIWPICLPNAKDTLDGFYNGAGECIVTGWGKNVLQSHLLGSVMHSLNVSLLNPGECQAKINQDYPHLLEHYDQDSCVCGQPTNPANNICKVDIGSALACTTGDNHFTLRGVYSWDSGCQTGNQLASFFKFDLEWYEWAIGLIESVRFSQYTTTKITKIITKTVGVTRPVTGAAITDLGTVNKVFGVRDDKFGVGQVNKFGTTITGTTTTIKGTQTGPVITQLGNGNKGFGVGEKTQFGTTTFTGPTLTGFKGFGVDQVNKFGTTVTGITSTIKGFDTREKTQTGPAIIQLGNGNKGFGVGEKTQFGTTTITGPTLTGFKGFGVDQVNKFGTTVTGTTSTIKGFGSGEKTQTGSITGIKGFGVGEVKKIGTTVTGTGTGIKNFGITGQTGQYGQFGTEIKVPVSNTFKATYTETKYFQGQPKIEKFTLKPEVVTWTYKPEIVTYTYKPEIFTYTNKPEIVTYTNKPEYFTFTGKPEIVTFKPQTISFDYQTSGTQTNTQIVPPSVSFNPSFSEVVGSKHVHDAKCKCLENGKK